MGDHEPAVILFDGVCNFCNAAVIFIIRRDPCGRFRFASIQSRTGCDYIARFPELQGVDSVILIEKDVPYIESSAGLRIARRLRGPWKMAALLLAVPGPLRDACYRFFARRRYRWFGRREACMLPTKEIRDRFISEDE